MADCIPQDCFTWLPCLRVKTLISPLDFHPNTHFFPSKISNYCSLSQCPGLPPRSASTQTPWAPHSVWLSLPTVEISQLYLENKRRCPCSADASRQIVSVMLSHVCFEVLSLLFLRESGNYSVSCLIYYSSCLGTFWACTHLTLSLSWLMGGSAQLGPLPYYANDGAAFLERSLSPENGCLYMDGKQWKSKAFPIGAQGKYYCPETVSGWARDNGESHLL